MSEVRDPKFSELKEQRGLSEFQVTDLNILKLAAVILLADCYQ